MPKRLFEREHFVKLHVQPCSLDVMLESNHWLEQKLRHQASFYENWLWLHNRWKIQHKPHHRFHIFQKRNALNETLHHFHLKEIPKKTRVWVRMPNWLGDIVMALPLLRSISQARPDFQLNLYAQKHYVEFLKALKIADFVHPLPEKKWSYFLEVLNNRCLYPDVWLAFTHSIRSDLEAWLINASQRFGMRKNFPRILLTHDWKTSTQHLHQTLLGYQFLKHFGLQIPLDLKPLHPTNPTNVMRIGCFCGSENLPEKRWPVEHWVSFLKRVAEETPQVECHLLGTQKDATLCQEIALCASLPQVHNSAGKTSLQELVEWLPNFSLIVGNDTGGMHLANALGVPVMVLYGPTSPQRTGPIFEGHKLILQSPTSSLNSLQPTFVYEQTIAWLQGIHRNQKN